MRFASYVLIVLRGRCKVAAVSELYFRVGLAEHSAVLVVVRKGSSGLSLLKPFAVVNKSLRRARETVTSHAHSRRYWRLLLFIDLLAVAEKSLGFGTLNFGRPWHLPVTPFILLAFKVHLVSAAEVMRGRRGSASFVGVAALQPFTHSEVLVLGLFELHRHLALGVDVVGDRVLRGRVRKGRALHALLLVVLRDLV